MVKMHMAGRECYAYKYESLGYAYLNGGFRKINSNNVAYSFTRLDILAQDGKIVEDRKKYRMTIALPDDYKVDDKLAFGVNFLNNKNLEFESVKDVQGLSKVEGHNFYNYYSDCEFIYCEDDNTAVIYDVTDGSRFYISFEETFLKTDDFKLRFKPFYVTDLGYLCLLSTDIFMLMPPYEEYITSLSNNGLFRDFISNAKSKPWKSVTKTKNKKQLDKEIEIKDYRRLVDKERENATPSFGLG